MLRLFFRNKFYFFQVLAVLIIAEFLLFTTKASAQSILWVACNDKNIYEINIDSCTSKLIGNSGLVFMDIAINPQDSVLYGVNMGNLYTIDKTNAMPTLVGQTISTNALNFDAYGNLYATGGQWEIYRIDPKTGAATNLGIINHAFSSAGDLTFYKGDLYLTCMPNLLVKINLNNVSASYALGNFLYLNDVFGTITLANHHSCTQIMYALEGRNIHQLDTNNLLNSFVKCPNIVPAAIFGAASLTEAISTIVVDLGSDTTICAHDSIVLKDLKNSIYDSLFWQNGSSNDSLIVNVAGSYLLTKQYNGCKFIDTINIDILEPPFINLGSDTSICGYEFITLTVVDSTSSYLWSDGSSSNQITVANKGKYWVDVNNRCGRSSDTINVEGCDCKLVIPNAFTPNNDGLNDIFMPIFQCEFNKYKFLIFNRWGELIFSTENPFEGWDGTYKGTNAPSDVYVYLINYTDILGTNKKIRGNFSLVK